MLETILVGVLALITGGVAALKVFAPKTKTDVDDKVLAFAEKYKVPVEEIIEFLRRR